MTPNNKKCKHKNYFYFCLFLFFFTSHCFIFRSFDFTDRHSRSLILRPLGVGRQPPVRLGDYTNWDKNDDFCHSRVVSKSIEIGIGLNEVPSSDIKAGRMRWKRGISRSQLIFDWSSEDGPTLSGVIYSRGWTHLTHGLTHSPSFSYLLLNNFSPVQSPGRDGCVLVWVPARARSLQVLQRFGDFLDVPLACEDEPWFKAHGLVLKPWRPSIWRPGWPPRWLSSARSWPWGATPTSTSPPPEASSMWPSPAPLVSWVLLSLPPCPHPRPLPLLPHSRATIGPLVVQSCFDSRNMLTILIWFGKLRSYIEIWKTSLIWILS